MIVLVILVVLIIVVISLYNNLIRLKTKCEESLSGIDVSLSRRYSILTNMVETVKGLTKHEKEVLIEIVKFRNEMSLKEKAQLNEDYKQTESRLIMLAEAYPDLKSNESFIKLQEALVDCEDHIQAARRFHNSNVALFNEKIQTFPSVFLANMMNLEKQDFFEADETDRISPKIEY